ncbi:MAG TPA: NAD(P)H-hydrate epimerase [Tepidisphaeraceae bacterium]|jgi:NAD(P)H-hydrate epimerase
MIRLTRAQVRLIDKLAIERYHIPGVVLMENAARAATDVACEMLDQNCEGQILILCGGGNNGGDGLALARHLHNRGADVTIALTTDPDKYRGEAKTNWDIVNAMGMDITQAEPSLIANSEPLLIVDAIFGTGLSQAPREPFGDLVKALAELRHVPILAIDIPSGLDCDTGLPLGPCIAAGRTVTFVAEKAGFARPESHKYTGHVTSADIGCPKELIAEVLQETPVPA